MVCQVCQKSLSQDDVRYHDRLIMLTDNEDLPRRCRSCHQAESDQQRRNDMISYTAVR